MRMQKNKMSQETDYEYVPAHDSQLSDESSEENVPTKRKLRSWAFVKVMTLEEVKTFIETEGLWSKHKPVETKNGLRYEYRCNRVKRRGPQCAAAIYLLYHSTNTNVSLFKTTAAHDHDDINAGACRRSRRHH